MQFRPFLFALVILAGCSAPPPPEDPDFGVRTDETPPGATPGTCWGKMIYPAVIETVTEQTESAPARYRTVSKQRIVEPRKEEWFETPCPDQFTSEFHASVQRALKVRGAYRGPLTGKFDTRTRAAIRNYQKARGLDSGILALKTARDLGLVAIEIEE